MRPRSFLLLGLFVLFVLLPCARASAADWRLIPQQLGYFTCGPETRWVLSSRDEAIAFLDALAEKCTRKGDPDEWKQRFLDDLDRAGVDFSHESVVLVQHVFGSGMIDARIDFELRSGRTLHADVRRIMPEGPLTPDIAVKKFAFAVDRRNVGVVVMLLDGKELGRIELPKAEGLETRTIAPLAAPGRYRECA